MEQLENELRTVGLRLTRREQLEEILNKTFRSIEDVTDVAGMTNARLRKIVQRIEVDREGNVDIYLRLLDEPGLHFSVPIKNVCT